MRLVSTASIFIVFLRSFFIFDWNPEKSDAFSEYTLIVARYVLPSEVKLA